MTLARAVRVALVPIVTTFGSLAACGDADRPPGAVGGSSGSVNVGSSGGAGVPDSGGEGGADSGSDGGSSASACGAGQAQLAQAVEEVVRPDTLPPPLGGAITPGTYVLNELNRYGGSDAGPAVAARATLYVTANTMTWIESRGPANALPNDQTRGGTFTAAGTTISLELACPQAGVATTIGYSAVGAGLALNVSATSREVYVKQ